MTGPTSNPVLAVEEVLVEDDAPALARVALLGEPHEQALADALAGHLDQAELGDVEDLGPGLVPGQRLAQDPTEADRPILQRFREQLVIASDSIDSGAAMRKLDEWVGVAPAPTSA